MKKTTDEFIKEAKSVHGDRYDYSNSIYESGKSNIKIVCKKHGEFKQRAKHHLDGSGCKKCSFEVVGENFQEERWTEQEKCLLAELIKTTSLRKICKKIKKSMKTVVKMLNKLGLSQEKRNTYKDYEDIKGSFWRIVENGAKVRNLEFEITQKYIWELYLKQGRKCALTNWPIIFSRKESRTASIDRINSNLGYIEGNVQIVHKYINKLKMAWSQEFLFDASKAIFLKRKSQEKRFKIEWEDDHWCDTIQPKRKAVKDNENFIFRDWDKELNDLINSKKI